MVLLMGWRGLIGLYVWPTCPGCGYPVSCDQLDWRDRDEVWHLDCWLEQESAATIIAALPE